ncbi:MAG: preprotein translocase subunit SecE [Proteobacteria bacterium]|nr:preprotein translocase subunit SecE [Pseudomonadota bacterium]
MVSLVVSDGPKLVDKLLWGLVLTILVGLVAGNYYFSQVSLLLRVVGFIFFAGLAIGLALKTVAGQQVWLLWLDAVQEVRKVHWPTRQETMQTTFAVLAMVVAMGILLWTADFLLLRLVKWLTGHWGA